MKPLPQKEPVDASILDAEWLMIHADRFLSDRDRIILQEKAFIIDRDFLPATNHLPNHASSDKNFTNDQQPRIS